MLAPHHDPMFAFFVSTGVLLAALAFAVFGWRTLARRFRRPRLIQVAVFGAAAVLAPLHAYLAVAGSSSSSETLETFSLSVQLATAGGLAGIGTLAGHSRIPVSATSAPRRVLAIGAHPDDLELGCGGTLAKLVDAGHEVHVVVMSNGERGGDATVRPRQARSGAGFLGATETLVLGLTDTQLGAHENEMVEAIEAKILDLEPHTILTHSLNDQHQDHVAVHLATLRAARFHSSILCFEAPSVTQAFTPSFFVDIDGYLEVKAAAVASHRDQLSKPYMTAERIRGLAVYRGGQAKVRHAEGYEPVRMLGRQVIDL